MIPDVLIKVNFEEGDFFDALLLITSATWVCSLVLLGCFSIY